MEILITVFILLLSAHWIADYPLQGDFLAKAKQEGPLRAYHLVAHAGIHAGFVTIITGSLILGLIEWVCHTIIDELKVRGKTSFAIDQSLHVICKIIYIILLGVNYV